MFLGEASSFLLDSGRDLQHLPFGCVYDNEAARSVSSSESMLSGQVFYDLACSKIGVCFNVKLQVFLAAITSWVSFQKNTGQRKHFSVRTNFA